MMPVQHDLSIAFDATAIPPNRAGAGVYIFNLVRHLAKVDRSNRYTVFVNGDYVDELAIEQPNVCLVPVRHRSVAHRLAWEQTRLPALVRRAGADVLHSPHYTMPIRKPGKSVVTFCDMIFYLMPEVHGGGRRAFFRAMMRSSARRADRLIGISESTCADVVRVLNVAAQRIVAVPLAAASVFEPPSAARTKEVCSRHRVQPGRYICYVGVLEPRKNIRLLLRAYARIASEFPEVPLLIAGKKGWMYDAIFEDVQALGLESRVRFPGYVPEEDLPALYGGSRVFVYPSRYEGFGLPVLEAMQCGAAVITTNVSSMPEVAGDAALLIDPDDIDELADKLRLVLTDDEIARELGRRGIARSAAFSWDRCARETIEVYRSLC